MTRHTFQCPTRWSDMDAYGHVNNVVFLTYLEEARVDMLFVLGAELGTRALADGVLVARHEIEYKAPLVFHPRGVSIEMWVSEVKGASFEIRYEVRDESTVFATAASTLVAYDLPKDRPRRLSPEERTFLTAYLES